MRLLLTMNLPYTRSHGGTNRSNRALAAALAARGHEVEAVVPALGTPSPVTHEQLLAELAAEGTVVGTQGGVDRFVIDGVRVNAAVAAADLRATLVARIERFRPDWVLASAEDPSQNLLLAALRAAPQRVVYLAHTPQMFPFGPASLYPSELRTRLIREARAIVSISRFVGDYVRRWTGVECLVCHPSHYGAGPWPRLGRFGQGRVLLMNASAIKGLPIFLGLARRMPEQGFAALPGYASTSADRQALAALPNVEIWNNHPDLDHIFEKTSVLLMPSLWLEGFGMAAVDAMLRGVPVLASDHGGLIEATLNLDVRLPVRPIEEFEPTLDDNLLPIPRIPSQPVAPWQAALTRLTTDSDFYQRTANDAVAAALGFVSRLDISPVESLLESLGKQSSRPLAAPAVAPSGGAPVREQLAALSPVKRALLGHRLWSRAEIKNEVFRISPAAVTLPAPLSPAQERMMFLHQLDGGLGAYNVPLAVVLRGALDPGILQRCFAEVQRRHAVLRTQFRATAEGFIQVEAEAAALPFSLSDLSALPATAQDQEVRRRAREQALTPFDLSGGLPWRILLLRRGPDDNVLLLTVHHAMSDGWSLWVLMRELTALYPAFSAGHASPLPALPIQYADYARWERARSPNAESLAYWRGELEHDFAPLELPLPRPDVPGEPGRGDLVEFAIPEDVAQAVARLAAAQGTTSFVVLLANLQLLLHRHSGAADILVGTPVANRRLPELEPLIGFFANTLVVKARPSETRTFRELVAQVRAATSLAQEHQDVSFEQLVRILQPEREHDRSPLFDVMFVYEGNAPVRELATGVTLDRLDFHAGTAKFKLLLSISEAKRGMVAGLEFRADVFGRDGIERLAGHFVTLLSSALEMPDAPHADLPLFSVREQELVSRVFAGADQPAVDQTVVTVPGLIENWVAQRGTVAVMDGGVQALSYRDLDAAARTVAARLQRMGVGLEDPVAVSVPDRRHLMASLLGVLKAGGCWVPLDGDDPVGRRAAVRERSRARVVLTTASLREALAAPGVEIVDVEALLAPGAGPLPDFVPVAIGRENLCCVLYRSGPNGRPEGLALSHGALIHRLTSAAAVRSPDEGERGDPGLAALEWLLSLSSDENLLAAFTSSAKSGLLEGRPLPGISARVLDRQLRPVGIGMSGELTLGGSALARGYLGAPGLTAERFIPDPFSGAPGARLFRSGVRAAWGADGQLLKRGRADQAIEIRGRAIFPAEVERMLVDHPGVGAAAVVAAADQKGEPALWAFVVPAVAVPERLARRPRQAMPNGLEVLYQRKSELEHFYEDIFVEQTYFKHGITLEPGAVVVDVGANIGMFSLFAAERCPTAQIYAFEPVPDLFELLQANLALAGANARLFPFALGASEEMREFTFYPESSGMSSFYADVEQETAVLRQVFRHEIRRAGGALTAIDGHTDEIIQARLRPQRIVARLRRLSDVLREQSIEAIDLLKIDVQKSEGDVLRGIDDAHWAGIRQMVVEVHDLDGRLAQICQQLEAHGLKVTVEQDRLFTDSVMYNLYACRPRALAGPAPRRHVPSAADLGVPATPPTWLPRLTQSLRDRLSARLAASSQIIPVSRLPKTSGGKIDRAVLRAMARLARDQGSDRTPGVAPRTELERSLIEILSARLPERRFGVHDNFFDIGAHSVMLLELQNDLLVRIGRQIPLVEFFRFPTVAGLARHLSDSTEDDAEIQDSAERGARRRASSAQHLRRRRQVLTGSEGEP